MSAGDAFDATLRQRAKWPWSDAQWERLFVAHDIPEHLRGGLRAYLEHGKAPGSFLCCVFQGDLFQAILRSDDPSGWTVAKLVRFLTYEAPAPAYGSAEHFDAWVGADVRPPMPNDLSTVAEIDR